MKKISLYDKWQFRKINGGEWRTVRIPHDAMLEEEREPDAPSGSAGAYFPGGRYEYLRELWIPEEWSEKTIQIEFEGIYQKAEIYLNGTLIGRITYGYGEGVFDLTSAAVPGQMNLLSVIVNNEDQPNSRWYTGSGIYRPVILYVMDKEYIAVHGIRITTCSIDPAVIRVETSVSAADNCELLVQVIEEQNGEQKVVAWGDGRDVTLTLEDAKLWSAENPNLYTCQVTLRKAGKTVDFQSAVFGVRIIEWSPDGLLINGRQTLLKGGCLHHDNGILGVRSISEAEVRKVRIMKEMGFNAIRSAHNPCSRSLLDACDQLGMYMMDETWDMWYQHKSKYDYADYFRDHFQDDIRSMVYKDYNHPSVILYSIGNEISEPAKKEGMEYAHQMIDLFHELDPSRPVTAGLNLMIVANAAKGKEMYREDGGINTETAAGVGGDNQDQQAQQMLDMSQVDSTAFNMMTMMIGSSMNHSADGEEADKATSPILDALDIAGYNYASGRYPLEGKAHPDRVIYGSETFPQEIGTNWEMVKQYPYLIGDFMWTAWDYLGEAGIGAWSYTMDAMGFDKPYPWLIGGAGVIDLIGHPDGEALYAKTIWDDSDNIEVLIAVTPANHPGVVPVKSAWRGTNAIPSWSWRGCDGNEVTVEVYTKAPVVRLMVNDRLIGEAATELRKATFNTVYEHGVLCAQALAEDGTVLSEGILCSAEGELHARVREDLRSGAAKEGLHFYEIDIVGENDVVESNADRLLELNVEKGEFLAFGTGRQRTAESFLDLQETTYYGRALAAVYGDAVLQLKEQ